MFVADVLHENRGMLGVFMDSGFRVSTTIEDGTFSVRFPIQPGHTYRAARSARHARSPDPPRHLDDRSGPA